eukprot:TRINITY_DN6202_c0_g1_i1.p1 TRINITY_DN6202_c0_g1~~TRINITY_DN6202_c0_g1_i1.p1  ORF type:complete len:452 (+),score=39.96 TRINITY_DN6202_c0_g1_i1:435-1790(+)
MAAQTLACLALLLLTLIATAVNAQPGCPQPGGPPPVGPVPTNCPAPLPENNGPLCGLTADASQFSITASGSFWRIRSNSCPNYDWTGQSSPARGAVQQTLNFLVPRHPILQKGTGTFVGISNPVKGPIGVAFNAVAMFSPIDALGRDALLFEGSTFDQCGGHVAPGPNIYHYHTMPGDGAPGSHNNSLNEDFSYCGPVAPLVGGSPTGHSPVFGIFYDGIPIYGPRGDNGQLPQNLDACNGHVDQAYPYYHYHATSTYPYLVNCLKGCVDQSTGNNNFGSVPCIPDDVQYDYSSLVSQLPKTALQAAIYNAPGTCDVVTGGSTPLNQCFNNDGSSFSCCAGTCGPVGPFPTCENGYTFPNPNTPVPTTGNSSTPVPTAGASSAPVPTSAPEPTSASGPTPAPGAFPGGVQPVEGVCDPYGQHPNQCFAADGSASVCCTGACPSSPSDSPEC